MTTVDITLPASGAKPKRVRRPVVALAGLILGVIVLVAIAPSLFTGTSPIDTDLGGALAGPSGSHWFGTDQLGRDIFTRVLYGTRPALVLALAATAFALIGGTAIGLASALSGRVADQVLMRIVDVFLALPPILLALLVITVVGQGTTNVAIAVAFAFIPAYARLVRAEALVVLRSGYVEAAVGLGLRRPVLIVRHVLPNTLGPLLVLATVGFGSALIYSSVLSFLGLGTRPPEPEWGSMLSEGRDFLQSAWWIGVFPGAMVTITVMALTTVGRYARMRMSGRAA
jgi:peptide/nickel transport system permease protein